MIRFKNRLLKRISSLIFLGLCTSICFLSGALFPPAPFAAIINGEDYQCSDLIPQNGDILSGDFANVSNFHIAAGVTVFVEPGTPLSINAASINIQGTLDGIGAGYAGGEPSPNPSSAGDPGEGPGGGEGGQHGACIHSSGGGGGAYGGNGGNGGSAFGSGPPPAVGGTAYGSSNPPGVDMGSGGGAAGNYCEGYSMKGGAGGSGGAAISLIGNSINISGNVLADGKPGSEGVPDEDVGAPSGGGGSGGGIEICGLSGSITGTVSANGGIGANGVIRPIGSYQQGGGGGGGGRIKISQSINTAGAIISVSGGAHGTSGAISAQPATDGQSGSVYLDGPGCDSSCSSSLSAIPTMSEWGMIIMSLLLAGSAIQIIRRRKNI